MRVLILAKRNAKEILRDPINLAFGLGFPVVLLLLLSAIQKNIPTPIFEIASLAPGITVFGLSFITLFSATFISRDRESAFLQRLYTTPLSASDFILGYMIPLLPLAVGQTVVCYLVAIHLGLEVGLYTIYAVLGTIPMALFNISLGLLCGSILNVKQVGGICGALLTNLTAWLSGVWFDLKLVGGFFEKIATYLPFYHGVEWEKALCMGEYSYALPHLLPILIYAVLVCGASVFAFFGQMKRQ